ncbi:hypothetical protein BDK51DRAFT_36893 [Blyttiomyces helicus]|uniref:Uncharacterized protein n=1 Tax=Blyttiomyces helicus TaxID=388810 RepID=A0A4P9VUS4_9FUNG|nr:hypothetical protein BDK51DRAFT_36893 [Blyttiomyces helicus]|eukprot:RKO82852.1 hypothetical protein BDK51DRAFT_36893 [Blyttiomyces helicus]
MPLLAFPGLLSHFPMTLSLVRFVLDPLLLAPFQENMRRKSWLKLASEELRLDHPHILRLQSSPLWPSPTSRTYIPPPIAIPLAPLILTLPALPDLGPRSLAQPALILPSMPTFAQTRPAAGGSLRPLYL